MTASTSVRTFIRQNIMGILALYVALGGSAYAAGQVSSDDIKDNAVRSNHIKNGQVKGEDVDETTLDAAVLQARVDSSCPEGQSIRAIDVDGVVSCETDDVGTGSGGGSPTGPAGGALKGTYPNPTLAADSVGGPTIAESAFTDEFEMERFITWGIAPDAIQSAEISDGTVASSDLAPGSVTATKIASSTFNDEIRPIGIADPTLGIAPNSVDGDDVLDGSITGNDIGNGSVFGADIVDDNLTGADINEGSLAPSIDAYAAGSPNQGPSSGGYQHITTAAETTLVSQQVPAGTYVASAEAYLESPGDETVICSLKNGADIVDVVLVNLGDGHMSLALSGAFTATEVSDVRVRCADWAGGIAERYSATSADLTLIPVSSVG